MKEPRPAVRRGQTTSGLWPDVHAGSAPTSHLRELDLGGGPNGATTRLDCFPVPYGIVGLVLAKRPCCDVMWASTADWLLHRFADFPRVLPSSDRMQPSEHAEPTVNNMAPPGRSCYMYLYNTIWSCLLLPIYWTACCRITNKAIPEPVISYNWNSRNKLVWVLTHLWAS